MGPMDDIISGCVTYLIGIGIVVGLLIAGLIYLIA